MDLDGEIDLWNIWSKEVGETALKSWEKGVYLTLTHFRFIIILGLNFLVDQ